MAGKTCVSCVLIAGRRPALYDREIFYKRGLIPLKSSKKAPEQLLRGLSYSVCLLQSLLEHLKLMRELLRQAVKLAVELGDALGLLAPDLLVHL